MSRIDSCRQRTLLEWAEQNPAAFYKPANAPRGAPHVYRFTFGSYVKYTVQVLRARARTPTSTSPHFTPIITPLAQDLVRDGRSKALKPLGNTAITVAGGPFLHWLASQTFRWSFPQHLQLYVALLDVRSPVATSSGTAKPLDLSHARAQFRQYAAPTMQAPPPATTVASASAAATDDDDQFVETEPAFLTANAIGTAQQAFFKSTVTGMAFSSYSSWDSLWVVPPDPTCARVFNASDFELLPVFFWSPERKWAHRGVRTPCPTHGWAHVDSVTVYEGWSQRLVKGLARDSCVGLQRCRCSACAKEVP